MDASTVLRACPRLSVGGARDWAAALTAAAEEFGIKEVEHQAMWLAQLGHESAGFTRLEESLNYSPERLAQVWPNRYALDPRAIHLRPNALAHRLGHKPDVIANDVYANRMGNGEPASGDGWRFRGRYPPMLTGRDNYMACYLNTGVPDLEDPDALLGDIPGMARVCGWFWAHNRIGEYAAKRDFDGVCDLWNRGHKTDRQGDAIGFNDRVAWHKRWLDAFGIA